MKIGKYNKNSEGLSIILFLLTGLLFISLVQCVTPFEPDISESADLINIDGSIVKGQEIQTVVISRSSSLDDRVIKPVGNCIVYITDNAGNRFDYSSIKKGIYTASIDDAFLEIGNSFQLHVITSSGETYESAFDTIFENQNLDSGYYISETQYSTLYGKELEGIQFHIYLKESESAAKYYRWQLKEIWEYHAISTLDSFYVVAEDSMYGLEDKSTDQFMVYYCYDAALIKNLYMSNTIDMKKNEKKTIPLHFTNYFNLKLSANYCTMVQQYSLGKDAYNYWNQKKVDLLESDGIYSTQPSQVVSNIRNINNPDETVLGFFWASAKKEKPFFYRGYYYYTNFCNVCEDTRYRYSDLSRCNDTLLINQDTIYYRIILGGLSSECIDCREFGGTTKKPEFWDSD